MRKYKIDNKIKNLNREIEYYKKVYPRSSKINNLKSKLYYYNKKLASLCD